jgi:hypothetical protein
MAGGSTALDDAELGSPVLQRERTLAVVLGVSEWPFYPEFHSTTSFWRSARDIADYLKAPSGLNLLPRNIKVLINSFDDGPEILRQIRTFIRDRQADLSKHGAHATDLLFYYVGHGGFTDNDTFFLSIRSTNEDDPLATSITAESLGRIVRDTAAGLRTYLVLDCCFAASVSKVFMGGGPLGVAVTQLQDALPPQGDAAAVRGGELPEYGTALLCASGSREPAKAPPHLPYTMFTGGMLEVLQKGDSNAPAWLSLDDMQRLVRARLSKQFADKAVLPQVHAPQQRMGRVDLVPLFRNPARHEQKSPLPPDLQNHWHRWMALLSDWLQSRRPHLIDLRAMMLVAVAIAVFGFWHNIRRWTGVLPTPPPTILQTDPIPKNPSVENNASSDRMGPLVSSSYREFIRDLAFPTAQDLTFPVQDLTFSVVPLN